MSFKIIDENGNDANVDEQAYVEYLIRMAIDYAIEFDESNDNEITPTVKQCLNTYTKNTEYSPEVKMVVKNALTNFIAMITDDRAEFSDIKFTQSVVAALLAEHLNVATPDEMLDIIQDYDEASEQLINDDDDKDCEDEECFAEAMAALDLFVSENCCEMYVLK